MNERIKMVRTESGLTMKEFADRLGLTVASVSRYESGDRIPSNSVITAICKEFRINYEWLTTGEGEKVEKSLDDETAYNLSRAYETASEVSERLAEKIRIISTMDKEWWKLVDKVFEEIDRRREEQK